MIEAVLFDLDGTLFDRDATVAGVLAWQVDAFGAVIGHDRSADFVRRVTALDEHGHRDKREVYEVGRCCFVGDHPTVDVAAAQAAGFQAFWKRTPYWSPAEPVPTIETLSDLLQFIS